jgi:hypothetical protein
MHKSESNNSIIITETCLAEEQHGFRNGCSATDYLTIKGNRKNEQNVILKPIYYSYIMKRHFIK